VRYFSNGVSDFFFVVKISLWIGETSLESILLLDSRKKETNGVLVSP
jgi:hypothetical protein